MDDTPLNEAADWSNTATSTPTGNVALDSGNEQVPEDQLLNEAQQQLTSNPQDARADRAAASAQKIAYKVKGEDLARRGIGYYTDLNSGEPKPLTDSTGSAITNFDKTTSVGYDSQGNPQKLTFNAQSGEPQLKNPYDDAKPFTDPKTGNVYKAPKGLPWQYEGTDQATTDQLQQTQQAKLEQQTASALTTPVAMARQNLTTAQQVANDSSKATANKLQGLGVPLVDGRGNPIDVDGDPAALKGHIENSFNQEYASPAANDKPLWGGDLTQSAQALRSDIERRKQAAMQAVDQHATNLDNVTQAAQQFDQTRAPVAAANVAKIQRLNEQRQAAGMQPVPIPQELQRIASLFNPPAQIPGLAQPTIPGLTASTTENFVPDPSKNAAWNQMQAQSTAEANSAGLPSVPVNPNEGLARSRILDAIQRVEASGYKVNHFMGQPNEPEGDRAPTMDTENLVKALQQKQSDQTKAGDQQGAQATAKELAYWQNDVAKNGMTAEEWKKGTGESDPAYPVSEVSRSPGAQTLNSGMPPNAGPAFSDSTGKPAAATGPALPLTPQELKESGLPAIAPFDPKGPSYRASDDGTIQLDPSRLSDGLLSALSDGKISKETYQQLSPKAEAAEKALQDQQQLVESNPVAAKIKAGALGLGRGSAFLAGSVPGAAGGAEIGAFGGPLDPITIPLGSAIGGAITGGIAAWGYDKVVKQLAKYSDTVNSFIEASQAHPNYDAAGNLISFAAGLPKIGTDLAAKGLSRLAGGGEGLASQGLQGTANAFERGIPGLSGSVQNLAEDAALRSARGASQSNIAGAIGSRVAGYAAANVAIDTVIKEGSKALGLSDEHQTLGGAAQAGLIGAFMSGHGIEFHDYSPEQVGTILVKTREATARGVDPSTVLNPNEMEVANAALAAINRAKNAGTADENSTVSVRQSTQHGQPYGVSAGKIETAGGPPPEATVGPTTPAPATPTEPVRPPSWGEEPAQEAPTVPSNVADVQKAVMAGQMSHSAAMDKLIALGLHPDDVVRAIGPVPAEPSSPAVAAETQGSVNAGAGNAAGESPSEPSPTADEIAQLQQKIADSTALQEQAKSEGNGMAVALHGKEIADAKNRLAVLQSSSSEGAESPVPFAAARKGPVSPGAPEASRFQVNPSSASRADNTKGSLGGFEIHDDQEHGDVLVRKHDSERWDAFPNRSAAEEAIRKFNSNETHGFWDGASTNNVSAETALAQAREDLETQTRSLEEQRQKGDQTGIHFFTHAVDRLNRKIAELEHESDKPPSHTEAIAPERKAAASSSEAGQSVPEIPGLPNETPKPVSPEPKAEPSGVEASPGTVSTVAPEARKGSTQVTLPTKEAKPFHDFANSIPESDVYKPETQDQPGGFGRETEPHVTALYGLTGEGDKTPAVAGIAAKHGPVTLTLGKISKFSSPDKPYDVLKIDVKSPQLHALNKSLRDLPHQNDYPDYHPHLTLAYVNKGAGDKYVGDDRFEGKTVTIPSLTHSSGERVKTEVPLSTPEQPGQAAPATHAENPEPVTQKKPAASEGAEHPAESGTPEPAPGNQEVDGGGSRNPIEHPNHAARSLAKIARSRSEELDSILATVTPGENPNAAMWTNTGDADVQFDKDTLFKHIEILQSRGIDVRAYMDSLLSHELIHRRQLLIAGPDFRKKYTTIWGDTPFPLREKVEDALRLTKNTAAFDAQGKIIPSVAGAELERMAIEQQEYGRTSEEVMGLNIGTAKDISSLKGLLASEGSPKLENSIAEVSTLIVQKHEPAAAAKPPEETAVTPPAGTESARGPPEATVVGPKKTKTLSVYRGPADPHFSNNALVQAIGNEGGIMSKSTARDKFGADKWERTNGEWDDAPKLAHPSHNQIYSASGQTPDEMAKSLSDPKSGSGFEGDANDLWRAIDQASQSSDRMRKQEAAQNRNIAAAEKQAETFDKDVHNPKSGDVVTVNDQKLKVIDVDEDGVVTLEDHSKYGIQTAKDGEVIYGQLDASEEAAWPSVEKDVDPVTANDKVATSDEAESYAEQHALTEADQAAPRAPDGDAQGGQADAQGQDLAGQAERGDEVAKAQVDLGKAEKAEKKAARLGPGQDQGDLLTGGTENTGKTATITNEESGTLARIGGQVVAKMRQTKDGKFVPDFNEAGDKLTGPQRQEVARASGEYTKKWQAAKIREAQGKKLSGKGQGSQDDMLDAAASDDPLFSKKLNAGSPPISPLPKGGILAELRDGNSTASRPQESLAKSISDYIGAGEQTGGRAPDAGGAVTADERERQKQSLAEWAKANGRAVTRLPFSFNSPNNKGGVEHDAWFDQPSQRWLKVTKPSFGLFPKVKNGAWSLGPTSVQQYLQKLEGTRELFGLDTAIHGAFLDSRGNPSHIPGAVDDAKIERNLRAAGFLKVDDLSSTYYRPSDNTMIFDAHPGNGGEINGKLTGFDMGVIHPEGELRQLIEADHAKAMRRQPAPTGGSFMDAARGALHAGEPPSEPDSKRLRQLDLIASKRALNPKEQAERDRITGTQTIGRASMPKGTQVHHFGNASVSEAGPITLHAGAPPLVAYHGTPHEVDKFSSEKIGTGEGAQVYGHGLYFAENDKVASEYKKALARRNAADFIPKDADSNESHALHMMQELGRDSARSQVEKVLTATRKQLAYELSRGKMSRQDEANALEGTVWNYTRMLKAMDSPKIREAFDKWNSQGSGNLYTVHLDAEPDELLDWDKPLSEQSAQVRDALKSLIEKYIIGNPDFLNSALKQSAADGTMSAEKAYQLISGEAHLANKQAGNPAALGSKALLDSGIAGIRYRDQRSRGAIDPEELQSKLDDAKRRADTFSQGASKNPALAMHLERAQADVAKWEKAIKEAPKVTHNYVMFDDSRIRIVGKNGEPVTMDEATALHAGTPPTPGDDRAKEAEPSGKVVPAPSESQPQSLASDQDATTEQQTPAQILAQQADDAKLPYSMETLKGLVREDPKALDKVRQTLRDHGHEPLAAGAPPEPDEIHHSQSQPRKEDGSFEDDGTALRRLGKTFGNIREKSGLASLVDDIQKVFSPDDRLTDAERERFLKTGDPNAIGDARKTSIFLDGFTAELARQRQQWSRDLAESMRLVDKLPEDGPAGQRELSMRIDEGTPLKAGPYSDMLDKWRDIDRSHLDQVKADFDKLGLEHWQNFENYEKYIVPHQFEDQKAADKVLDSLIKQKKRVAGGTSWLKHRQGVTIREMVEHAASQGITLQTRHANPIRAGLDRWTQQARYIGAHKLMQQMVNAGILHWEGTDYQGKPGEQMVNNIIGQRTAMVDGQPRKQYAWGNEQSANIVNNYLSIGLRQGHKWVDNYFKVANMLNGAQLGFSFFHGGFVTVEGMVSNFALGLQKLAAGDMSGLKNIAGSPFSTWHDWKLGRKIRNEMLNPGTNGDVMKQVVDSIVSAGFRDGLDSFYDDNHVTKFLADFRNGKMVPAALRAPFAAVEGIASPLMKHFVPAIKAAVIYKLAEMHLKQSPDIDPMELRRRLQEDVRSGNNRLGQMTYDNLHLHKASKDLMMGATRSLGWNWGTFAEIGGGIGDWARFIPNAAKAAAGKGAMPRVTNKMAYTLALPILVGALGAAMSALFGQKPEQLKDYYFVKTGDLDEKGQPIRVALPSYMKDVFHAAKDPASTITNKLHPLLSTLGDMLRNKDFYGTEIRHAGDPVMKQILQELGYAAKQFMPFTARNATKLHAAKAPLILQAGGLVGITQAPADVNKSDAQNLADRITRESMPTRSRTSEEAVASQLRGRLIATVRQGNQAELSTALRNGQITPKQATAIQHAATMTPLQLAVSHMDLNNAQRVFEKATPEERRQLQPLIAKKQNTTSNQLAGTTRGPSYSFK